MDVYVYVLCMYDPQPNKSKEKTNKKTKKNKPRKQRSEPHLARRPPSSFSRQNDALEDLERIRRVRLTFQPARANKVTVRSDAVREERRREVE